MKRLLWALIFIGLPVYADETIQIIDDGINPINSQKVIVMNSETKLIEEKTFDGTFSDVISDIKRLTIQKDDIAKQIDALIILQQKLDAELKKLPPRK